MLLEGSCHCNAVRFSLESHTPYPYMRCYCSICRKTQGGGGYAINIMGLAETLKIRGKPNISIYRVRLKGRRQPPTQFGATAFLRPLRQRVVGVRSAVAGSGAPLRFGHRHAIAQTAADGAHLCRLGGRLGTDSPWAERSQLRRVPRAGDHRLASRPRLARGLEPRFGATFMRPAVAWRDAPSSVLRRWG